MTQTIELGPEIPRRQEASERHQELGCNSEAFRKHLSDCQVHSDFEDAAEGSQVVDNYLAELGRWCKLSNDLEASALQRAEPAAKLVELKTMFST